ncbi:hypothetical protein GQ54DRAFT_295569 [Martensiomyces pterosporus]|nr:hypothetical protein GQ54DRAFT_295569 [Martensiomyces pterosporus]
MAVSVSSVSGFPASSLLLTSSLHHVPAPPCSSSVFPPEMAGAAQVPALCTPAPGSTPEIAADGSAQSSSGHTGRRHEASPPLQLYATLQNEADAITDASSAYLCAGSWDHGRGTQDGSRSGSATTPTPLALGAAYELSPLFDGAAPDSVADMDMATDDNSSNGVAASRGRRSNRRTTLSTRQKREFYVWLANNTDTPYPSEEDRLGCLNIDNMDKKKFGYWFANIRSRQFDKVRTPDGRRQFVPNAKFYGTCRRLRIGIPATVPEDSIGLA